MRSLFTEQEITDLLKRELPQPSVKASLPMLEGAVLFGAGRFSRALLAYLSRFNIRPAWFVDNNSSLWGQEIEGIPIRSVDSLKEVGDRCVIIMSDFFKSMSEECLKAKVANWTWFTDLQEVFGDQSYVTALNPLLSSVEVERGAALFAEDAASLQVYKKAISVRVTGDSKDLPALVPNQYFVPNLVPTFCYAHFVDCGAFNGDTLKDWLRFRENSGSSGDFSYHAFEPDPDNFSQLKVAREALEHLNKENIVLHPCAVGDEEASLRMIQGGPGSQLYSNLSEGVAIPVVRLEKELQGKTVTAIKMDLEGFEPKALVGAKALLQAQRPALMIAVYHRVEHLWQIPLWIHDLGLKYKFRLCHHDTSPSETICYAIPQ